MAISTKNMPGTVTPAVFHILLSLLDGPKHGYAIMKEVDERTDGEVQLPPGTLYRSLQKMRREGLVEMLDEPSPQGVHDTRRRSYRLTPQGTESARNEAERLDRLVAMARSKQLIPSPESV
ncbi:MAG: PadR family transcriptional regulator [Acidobacteriota bacterium]